MCAPPPRQELTQLASETDPAPPSQGPPLDLEQLCNPAFPQQMRQLQVLRVVAMLTEGISDSLLTDVRQVGPVLATPTPTSLAEPRPSSGLGWPGCCA